MNDDHPLLTLLIVFGPLSLLTIGGGSSILGDVQREVVSGHGWTTLKEFQDMYAISRVTPGPGLLFVTLVGWHVAGWLGALMATAAVVVPSSLLMYALSHAWHSGASANWQKALSRGLAPIAAGLILASVFQLLTHAEDELAAWIVALSVAGLASIIHKGQFLLMGGGAVVFAGLHFLL